MSNLTNELHLCRHWARENQLTEAEMWLNARLYEMEHLAADEMTVTAPARSIVSVSETRLRELVAGLLGPGVEVDDVVRAIDTAGYAIVKR